MLKMPVARSTTTTFTMIFVLSEPGCVSTLTVSK
jgi:hypothetical protein